MKNMKIKWNDQIRTTQGDVLQIGENMCLIFREDRLKKMPCGVGVYGMRAMPMHFSGYTPQHAADEAHACLVAVFQSIGSALDYDIEK